MVKISLGNNKLNQANRLLLQATLRPDMISSISQVYFVYVRTSERIPDSNNGKPD